MTADRRDGTKVSIKIDATPLARAGVALALVDSLLLAAHHKLVHLVGREGEACDCNGLALTTNQLHVLLWGRGTMVGHTIKHN